MFLRALSGVMNAALLASRVACIIVLVWFVLFAIDESHGASSHQLNEVAEAGGSGATGTSAPAASGSSNASATAANGAAAKPSAWRRKLNLVAKELTSPFASVTAHTRNAWLIHGADTLLALLLYGFCFGFVMRMVRIRV